MQRDAVTAAQSRFLATKLVAGRPVFLALSALCYLRCVPCVAAGGLCQCVHMLRDDAHIRDDGLSRVEVMDEKVPTALAESRETPQGSSSAMRPAVVAMSRSVRRRS